MSAATIRKCTASVSGKLQKSAAERKERQERRRSRSANQTRLERIPLGRCKRLGEERVLRTKFICAVDNWNARRRFYVCMYVCTDVHANACMFVLMYADACRGYKV